MRAVCLKAGFNVEDMIGKDDKNDKMWEDFYAVIYLLFSKLAIFTFCWLHA